MDNSLFTFPVGYQRFHKKQLFNYQLNRWYSLGYLLYDDKIKQDVLIITGRNDHFIPFKLHAPLIRSLTNAASVTDRVFTRKDNANNHCSIGNIKLSLDTMINWLDKAMYKKS